MHSPAAGQEALRVRLPGYQGQQRLLSPPRSRPGGELLGPRLGSEVPRCGPPKPGKKGGKWEGREWLLPRFGPRPASLPWSVFLTWNMSCHTRVPLFVAEFLIPNTVPTLSLSLSLSFSTLVMDAPHHQSRTVFHCQGRASGPSPHCAPGHRPIACAASPPVVLDFPRLLTLPCFSPLVMRCRATDTCTLHHSLLPPSRHVDPDRPCTFSCAEQHQDC